MEWTLSEAAASRLRCRHRLPLRQLLPRFASVETNIFPCPFKIFPILFDAPHYYYVSTMGRFAWYVGQKMNPYCAKACRPAFAHCVTGTRPGSARAESLSPPTGRLAAPAEPSRRSPLFLTLTP